MRVFLGLDAQLQAGDVARPVENAGLAVAVALREKQLALAEQVFICHFHSPSLCSISAWSLRLAPVFHLMHQPR